MPNRRDPNKTCVAFWATEELKAALQERAKAEGKSMSELLVEALEEMMNRNKETNNDDANRD